MKYKYKGREQEYEREYRRKNWDRIKAYRRRRTEEQRAYLDTLRAAGCADCGITDPRVLDFHHLTPKNGRPALTTLVGTGTCSLKRIQAEAARCVVVCANCHRIRHGPDVVE